MRINSKRELQNIAINHSAYINYKDFLKIYMECTKEPYSFLTIDTTLPASDPLRFRKNCLILTRMTVVDQIKILENKIKSNQAQYDLGREVAKMSTQSSKDLLEKYEYLTSEDLGHRPSTLEKNQFEYSLLGKIFTKELDKDDQKLGLFKRLKNTEEKNEELPNALREAIKAGKNASYESNFYYDPMYNFCRFYNDEKNLELKL